MGVGAADDRLHLRGHPADLRLLGIPQRYYDVSHDAPGARELAARIEALLGDCEPIAHDPDRRLDHGAIDGYWMGLAKRSIELA